MTKHLNVFKESSITNACVTYKALADFGTPPERFLIDDFSNAKTAIRLDVPPICFEVAQKIDGVNSRIVNQNSVHSLSMETYPPTISPLQTISSINLHPVGLKIWPM